MRAVTRFPAFALGDGGYESYYLRAVAPDRPQAIWLRHTIHKQPGGPPDGSIWLSLFDGAADAPAVRKRTYPDPSSDPATYIRIAGSAFTADRVAGAFEDTTYDIAFRGDEPVLYHLPRPWMYKAPVPRTKLESPHPSVTLSGTVKVGDRSADVDGWLGMIGHNWGGEHAERWIWLHGVAFEDVPGAWVDLALGRVKLGRVTTPWIGNGMVGVGGRRLRVGGLLGRAKVDEDALRLDFELRGKGLSLKGSAHSPRAQTVVFRYADPDLHEHHAAHCSLAALDLILHEDGQVPLRLHTPHAGCYELGMREADHGLPVQPFADP